mmetsp:Transcript_36845/g.44411  ORF Transcript_36845/g.44411 Transcript_36845/m.44411 type:complete len:84 (+) Transcript_36845:69-320(+)
MKQTLSQPTLGKVRNKHLYTETPLREKFVLDYEGHYFKFFDQVDSVKPKSSSSINEFSQKNPQKTAVSNNIRRMLLPRITRFG